MVSYEGLEKALKDKKIGYKVLTLFWQVGGFAGEKDI